MMPDNTKTMSAVVLAGRRNDGKLKDCATEEWEALIDIGGRPMVSYVLDALLSSSYVGHIFLVAPRDVFGQIYESDRVSVIEPGDSIVENCLKGCHATPEGGFVLISTSDLPFLSADVVDAFVRQCFEKDADFYYPAVLRDAVENRFPGVKRTFVSIKDGDFTGGNVFVARRSVIDTVASKAGAFIENRKSPIKQAGVLGWGFIIKLLLHTLTIDELERTITRSFGARAAAVVTSASEIGVDVDKPSDLALARSMLDQTA